MWSQGWGPSQGQGFWGQANRSTQPHSRVGPSSLCTNNWCLTLGPSPLPFSAPFLLPSLWIWGLLSTLGSPPTCPRAIILATFPLNSHWHVHSKWPLFGLTLDQGGDRAQTKQAQCRGGGEGGRGETDHLPSTPGLIWSTLEKEPSSSPFIYSTLLCSPLSCLLSLCSALLEIPTHTPPVGPLAPHYPHQECACELRHWLYAQAWISILQTVK